jgi:ATP-dependent Clp protease ATP-binding subunit ClpA
MPNDPRLIYSYLRSHIVGQDVALRQIANHVEKGEGKLSSDGRPKASFLLLGPTGVGKTETAKQTAVYLYGSLGNGYKAVDMAEYSSRDSVESFKQQVTEALSQRPGGGILLLDEIEKAHQEVTNNCLQMLEEARLSYHGVTHDLTHWYVFCTSNLGCAEMMTMKHSAYATIARTARNAAEQHLRPENVVRFNEVCVFQLLPFAQQQDICRAMLDAYLRVVQERTGLEALYGHEEVQYLLRKGFNRRLGARPLRNAIETEVALAVLQYQAAYGALAQGERVSLCVTEDKKRLQSIPLTGGNHDRVEATSTLPA